MHIAMGVLGGVRYLHSKAVWHRDLKPNNVLITFSAPSIRVCVADFGLACYGRPDDVLASSQDSDHNCTAMVCSDGYVPPELLLVRGSSKEQNYGAEVDVWSTGCICFELATLTPFIQMTDPTAQLACVLSRLSLTPDVIPNAARKSVRVVWAKTSTKPFGDELPQEPWIEVVASACAFDPASRGSAEHLWQLLARSSSVQEPCRHQPSEASTAAASVIIALPPPPSTVAGKLDLGARSCPRATMTLPNKETCNCSGNCKQAHHSRNGCDSRIVMAGGKYCAECVCEWLDCVRPRLKGLYCCRHSRIISTMCPSLRLMKAAGSLHERLVPCDVDDFVLHYPAIRLSFLETFIVAMVKEPSATTDYVTSLASSSAEQRLASAFHFQLLLRIVRSMAAGGQKPCELEQLSRQGDVCLCFVSGVC
jgi:serine/threonine protein kinase